MLGKKWNNIRTSFKKLKKGLLKSRTYKKAITRLNKTKVSKNTVPLIKVIQTLYKKLTATNVHQQASAIAFSFTLSLFPAMLFLFSLIPYIASNLQIPDLADQVLDLIQEGIPEGIYEFVAPTITDIIENPRGDLLSFGFLFAIYAATSGVVELMHTFNMNYKFSEKRTFIKKRLVAISLAFLFAFLLVFAVAVMIVGELVLNILRHYNFLKIDFYYLFIALRYLVSFLVFYIGISYIYYIAPAIHKQWRFFSLGSTIASVLAILSTNGFSYYLSHFATYNKLYGSIGTLIALMIWLYLLAWILLLGFTLNASINEAKIEHQEEMEEKYDLLEEMEKLEDDVEHKK